MEYRRHRIRYVTKTICLFLLTVFSSSIAQDNTQVGLPEGAIGRLGKGGINIMRFSPDGTRFAVGTDVGVWVYTVPDGKGTALFTGEPGQVNALAFSPDGKLLASTGADNLSIWLWDLETYTKRMALPLVGGHGYMSGLAFYGNTLLSLDGGSGSGRLSYWQVNNVKVESEIEAVDLGGHYDALAFSQDSETLAVVTRDKQLCLWDTTTGEQLPKQIGDAIGDVMVVNNDDVLALSPDGKILAIASEENNLVKLWDIEKAEQIHVLQGHNSWITSVMFSPDGKTIATGGTNEVINLWNIETQQTRATLKGHQNTINALAFAPKNTPRYSGCLASGSADGTIRFWDPDTGKELVTFATGHTEWIKAVAFSEDGTTLTTAAYNGNVDTWNILTREKVAHFAHAHSDGTEQVVLSPNAKFLAIQPFVGLIAFNPYGWGTSIGSRTQELEIWSLTTENKLTLLPRDRGYSTPVVSFSPDSHLIAIGKKQTIRGWHLNTRELVFELNTERHSFRNNLIFSGDGTKLAASATYAPRVFDITMQTDITPAAIAKDEGTFALSPDGKILATSGSKKNINLWNLDAPQQKPVTLPTELFGLNIVLTFSPDGKTLIAAEMETLKLIDTKSGDILATFIAHTEPIEALVFSPDRKILATGSEDGTVLLWNWEKIASR